MSISRSGRRAATHTNTRTRTRTQHPRYHTRTSSPTRTPTRSQNRPPSHAHSQPATTAVTSTRNVAPNGNNSGNRRDQTGEIQDGSAATDRGVPGNVPYAQRRTNASLNFYWALLSRGMAALGCPSVVESNGNSVTGDEQQEERKDEEEEVGGTRSATSTTDVRQGTSLQVHQRTLIEHIHIPQVTRSVARSEGLFLASASNSRNVECSAQEVLRRQSVPGVVQ